MSDACVLLVPGRSGQAGAPAGGRTRPGRRLTRAGASRLSLVAAAALAVGLDETVVVLGDESLLELLPEGVTVLLEEGDRTSEASALRVAVDWCSRAGHGSVTVVSLPAATARREMPPRHAGATRTPEDVAGDPRAWKAVASAGEVPVAIGVLHGDRTGPVRLPVSTWPLLPLDGAVAALWHARPELVAEVSLDVLVADHEPEGGSPRTAQGPAAFDPEAP